MKKILAVTIALFAVTMSSQNNAGSIASKIKIPLATLAITHVSIVNVITGKIDTDHTIIIDRNRIIAVGPFSKTKIPPGSEIINASGKYAMPGLTDGHIHFFQSGGLYTRPDAISIPSLYPYEKDQQWIKDNIDDLLARYLACGITNVVDVGGPMSNFAIRDRANSSIAAPNALVTGPLIATIQPSEFSKEDPPIIKATTPEDAIALVRKQLSYKPDFIKVWYIAKDAADAARQLPMVKAVVKESHGNGLKVCVHATEYETASLAVDAGADILVHSVEDKVMFKPLLSALKAKNVIYIPTLQVHANYLRTFSQRFSYTPYDLKYANAYVLGTTMDLHHIERSASGMDFTKMRSRPLQTKRDTIMAKNLMLVKEEGITIVAGTDAGNIGTQHASSLLTELQLMKAAGLSELEVLRSATINSAKAFGKDADWGSIEKNKMADLLLLDSNPLESLDALIGIKTVIHRGVPIDTSLLLPTDAANVAQQQLNAYNAKNIEAFLETYSDTAEIYELPAKLIAKGKPEIKRAYEGFFNSTPDAHAELIKRTLLSNMVIDQLSISGLDVPKTESIAIYEIENGKIVKTYYKH